MLAQHERETISKRTKNELAAKKARGDQLDTPANLMDAARQQSLQVRRQQIQQHPSLRQATAFISSRRAQGVSFRQLTGELNTLGCTAPHREDFKQVQRFYERVSVVTTTPTAT